jgi:RNA polymerase sigma factor (sigma-70 family)
MARGGLGRQPREDPLSIGGGAIPRIGPAPAGGAATTPRSTVHTSSSTTAHAGHGAGGAADGGGPADLVLVQSALRGQPAAVEALLTRLGCVVRFVYRLNRTLGHGLPTEALEDVVQQVYAALWPRLREFHGRNPLETWLFGFCRNCLRGAARRQQRQARAGAASDARGDEPLSQAQAPFVDQPEILLQRREVLAALQDELDALPADQREAVQARHLEGCSFEDLARQSGVAVSTIKDRCYRAMQRLRERLGRRLAGG